MSDPQPRQARTFDAVWATTRALIDVRDERGRQDDRWGEQNHPDGTGGPEFRVDADSYRAYADVAAQQGTLTWRHILLEELFEALAESEPAPLREELLQVAAVAVAWVEAIDRRQP